MSDSSLTNGADVNAANTNFSEAVKTSVDHSQFFLFNKDIDLPHPMPGSQLVANLTKEIEQYFTSGNSDGDGIECRKLINPTLFQPKTGKWFVHLACCPFVGYAPLPLKELDRSVEHNRIAFEYCQAELKKLLITFKKRKETVTFDFHPCDPLLFCYQDSPLSFDIIHCSFLEDEVGLVNLLNAAARKLHSEQSILVTESRAWPFVALDMSRYLQTVLCCPLSLIPTMYGLRLMENVELGPDTFISMRNSPIPISQLRWKKAQPFEGVALAMSPLLEQTLERLRKFCFLVKDLSDLMKRCAMICYSPLTFHYVVCDLIQRGGLPATAMESFHPPSFFRTSEKAIQAWKECRPVWRVNVCIKFDQDNQTFFYRMWNECTPSLRLILAPHSALLAAYKCRENFLELFASTESHFIDNLDVNIKRKANGEIDLIYISFLLADRNLLKNHSGVIVAFENQLPLLTRYLAMTMNNSQVVRVEKFSQPYPYPRNQGEELSVAADCSKKLTEINCQESRDAFTLRFNFCCGDKLPKSQPSTPSLCLERVASSRSSWRKHSTTSGRRTSSPTDCVGILKNSCFGLTKKP